VKEFFADGKVRVLTQFKGGKKHGRYELNHEGGKSRVKGQYSSGEPSGTWEFRDEQGRLEEKKIYAGKNWRKEAYFVETGKLSQEQDWVDGRPAREKRYWENGKLRFDRAKAPDKSSVYRAYDREGRLEEEGRTVYRELSYSGWFPSFYMDDGWGLWSSFAYRFSNDVLDGPRVYHYSDGSKSAEKFKEGRPDGVWTDYDPKGRVVSEHVYAAGVLTEERDFKHGKLSETRKIAKDGSVLSTTKKSSPPPSSI
ncbi:MAG TPA: hypothetical protein VM598_03520, partial [Bdellovibrionota bacterium]|nr:hypothetical protein [Bdellovibrionota bacterium]